MNAPTELVCQVTNFQMLLNLNDRIQRRIFLKKCHEPETEQALNKFFKEASCFFDIGGNIGFFSLQAASLNPNLKVIAFEPLDNNINQFKKSIALNPGFKERISIKEVCLGDKEGTVTFLVPPEGECGWGTVYSEDHPNKNDDNWPKIERQSMTLDQFIEENPELKPDVIKVDVEGSEYRVLQGALKYLENNPVKMLCIELNEPTLKSFGTSSNEVIELMDKLGYQASVLSNGQLVSPEITQGSNADFNYFFTPNP
jgi:FkbM family methyltransferase